MIVVASTSDSRLLPSTKPSPSIAAQIGARNVPPMTTMNTISTQTPERPSSRIPRFAVD